MERPPCLSPERAAWSPASGREERLPHGRGEPGNWEGVAGPECQSREPCRKVAAVGGQQELGDPDDGRVWWPPSPSTWIQCAYNVYTAHTVHIVQACIIRVIIGISRLLHYLLLRQQHAAPVTTGHSYHRGNHSCAQGAVDSPTPRDALFSGHGAPSVHPRPLRRVPGRVWRKLLPAFGAKRPGVRRAGRPSTLLSAAQNYSGTLLSEVPPSPTSLAHSPWGLSSLRKS